MKKIDSPKKTLSKIFSKHHSGLTLIEIMVVVGILAILMVLFLFMTFRQVSKGRDGKRKADLEKIKVAFEDYYNDNGCYPNPADGVLEACGEDSFEPYLDTIPCDPLDNQPYIYIPADSGPCDGYKILTKLENTDDSSITGIGCDPVAGCGYDDASYNYGVSQGIPVGGEGSFGGGGDDDYPGDTPEYDDDWYCTVELDCTILSRRNAEERNCPKLYEYSAATPPAECVTECNPSHPAYSSVVCDPEN